MSFLGCLNFNPNPEAGGLSWDRTMPVLCCDQDLSASFQTWLKWTFFGGKKKLLVSEKAHSRSCTPSAPCNGTSQATTTSGATHSLQEPLLLCPSEIQPPLNSGEGEGWPSWWNRISLWLFKYKSHVSWRQVFHRDHGCAETKIVIPAIHSFQESLPVAQVPYWNVTYIDASGSVVSH